MLLILTKASLNTSEMFTYLVNEDYIVHQV
jgi:hypothetical protein